MFMKKILLILCISVLLVGCSNNKDLVEKKDTMIKVDEVYSLLEKDEIILIDVRTVQEYHSGHIDGAMSIPLDTLNEISSLEIEKDSKIVVYCRSGNRSKTALQTLIDMGYSDVYDMGGIESWPYDLVQ
ncbi:MAG: rhodanese-like domain-containing protein [Firmicutes bacterium]|nr:rhodanese-like domain-containing protein [Bacillota bacterium]